MGGPAALIRFGTSSDGTLMVGQQLISPSVYLDHWAIRHVSENGELRNRLVTALMKREGTLAISWISLAEFSRVDSESERRSAEALVEEVLPNLFLIESNPFQVANREVMATQSVPDIAPQADQDFLRALVSINSKSLKLLTATDIFSILYEAHQSTVFADLADTIVERLEALRAEVPENVALGKGLHATPDKFPLQSKSLALFRELSRRFLIDTKVRITRNHAIDLLHATVPSAYCDYVLLDGHWSDAVERARRRFQEADLKVSIAKVFSGREGGLERFFQVLEDGTDI